MTKIAEIKLRVIEKLQELVDEGVISQVKPLAYPRSLFSLGLKEFPVVIIDTPSRDGSRLDNQTNEIIYSYDLIYLTRTDLLKDSLTKVEEHIDAICYKFANNETLGGLALAIEPALIQTGVITEANREMVVCVITIKIRCLEELTN
jgi:hypothetical protein